MKLPFSAIGGMSLYIALHEQSSCRRTLYFHFFMYYNVFYKTPEVVLICWVLISQTIVALIILLKMSLYIDIISAPLIKNVLFRNRVTVPETKLFKPFT